ncbi:acyl-CoA reductase [Eisenibacter elegans]|jgi:hypothetical protein|uniref:acyl-CoA reductase n=1 Tax=Eisenibacter elegans TaxID=997 RepID=UPI000407123B|nr:acyl-CoA reductase [Eisenibacter elegans]
MNISQKIDAFVQLGLRLQQLSPETRALLYKRIEQENPWFTPESLDFALAGIGRFLDAEALAKWVSAYPSLAQARQQPKRIGVIMAGNIPAVGFHDFLSVLLSGHQLQAKLSSQDSLLLPFIASQLLEIAPDFAPYIQWVERLEQPDAVIATGSDNTYRYFEHYFGQYPHILRRNRVSCAVLDGNESAQDLQALAEDVFRYFGLGCRNVAKLFVPKGYSPVMLLDNFEHWNHLAHHNKYMNNYSYRRSVLLINQLHHWDNGFLLLREDETLTSHIGVLHLGYYEDDAALDSQLRAQADKLQCVVSRQGYWPNSLPLGTAQTPVLEDYADGIDTLEFLIGLS